MTRESIIPYSSTEFYAGVDGFIRTAYAEAELKDDIKQALGSANCVVPETPEEHEDIVWKMTQAAVQKLDSSEVTSETWSVQWHRAELQVEMNEFLIGRLTATALTFASQNNKLVFHDKARILDHLEILGFSSDWKNVVHNVLPVAPNEPDANHEEVESRVVKTQLAWDILGQIRLDVDPQANNEPKSLYLYDMLDICYYLVYEVSRPNEQRGVEEVRDSLQGMLESMEGGYVISEKVQRRMLAMLMNYYEHTLLDSSDS